MNRPLGLFSVYNNLFHEIKMADDILEHFYSCLKLRLDEKIIELTKLIDYAPPTKELQALFPQLVSNIFASSFSRGWNLKTITCKQFEGHMLEFEALIRFFEPQGPMFRLCYKLMSDQQLKYELPLNLLPLDLQMSLERGRCSQFYSDMLVMDSQTMSYVALALNPFDYYIFNFALHLVNEQNPYTLEKWNSAYFTLACDYLMHFLPSDPNVPVLPLIPNYTEKVSISMPMQTANRPLYTPSLLLIPELCGMSNQHSAQSQSRNEVWRSETVLQVFVDIWMSVDLFNTRDRDLFQRSYQATCSTPETVRTVRVLVKHIHAYSAKHQVDPASRSSALRKYARQIVCARAYHYVKHLVQTWPLDSSFRLVLELWLSLIQPWRYTTNNDINRERFLSQNNNQEEGGAGSFDLSYMQFIAENYASYTCIFQLVLPRFIRMDLTVFKNAVMLFRLGKVFSQQHLIPILRNLECAMLDSGNNIFQTNDSSYHNSTHEQSYTYDGIAFHKWIGIAKQSISESSTLEYDPIWSESKTQYSSHFVKKIHASKLDAENHYKELEESVSQQYKGILGHVKHWFMFHDIIDKTEDVKLLEECKKVPAYLNNCINYFTIIFGLDDSSLLHPDAVVDSSLENSSFANTTNFTAAITNKLRAKPTSIEYMGDPDLTPITSYESTILLRMLYQIASKLNEVYKDDFCNVYYRNSLLGFMAREVLEKPCTIRNYAKEATNPYKVVTQDLPPRLSLRRIGSHSFVFWFTLGYILFKLFSYSGFTYLFILISLKIIIVFTRAFLKMLKIIRA